MTDIEEVKNNLYFNSERHDQKKGYMLHEVCARVWHVHDIRADTL